MNENTCLYCNEVIPEGRMICPLCESRLSDPDFLKIMRNESTSKIPQQNPKEFSYLSRYFSDINIPQFNS